MEEQFSAFFGCDDSGRSAAPRAPLPSERTFPGTSRLPLIRRNTLLGARLVKPGGNTWTLPTDTSVDEGAVAVTGKHPIAVRGVTKGIARGSARGPDSVGVPLFLTTKNHGQVLTDFPQFCKVRTYIRWAET